MHQTTAGTQREDRENTMYKIIASDLDETLLNRETRLVGVRNLEAIRRASEMGVKFVPASGRGYATIQKTLEELGLRNKENEYIISFNGGAITENKNNPSSVDVLGMFRSFARPAFRTSRR